MSLVKVLLLPDFGLEDEDKVVLAVEDLLDVLFLSLVLLAFKKDGELSIYSQPVDANDHDALDQVNLDGGKERLTLWLFNHVGVEELLRLDVVVDHPNHVDRR